jgi:hypothetical protein
MFDIHQSVCDEDGELDPEKMADFIDGLMNEFAQSPGRSPHRSPTLRTWRRGELWTGVAN